MPGQEREKFEGGSDLNEEQVKNIVVQVLASEREKGKTTQDLGVIRSEVGGLKEQLAQVQQALYCTKDGKFCFNSPEELTAFMQSQKEKMDGLDSKIGEVVSQVKMLKPAPSATPEGLQRLPDVTPEIRGTMSKDDAEARDEEVKVIAGYFNMSLDDLWRQVTKDPISLDVIAKKGFMRKRVFDGVSDGELKKMTLMACKDGKCKPFREGMEKAEGVRFYSQDDRGRWQPVDQPKPEPSRI